MVGVSERGWPAQHEKIEAMVMRDRKREGGKLGWIKHKVCRITMHNMREKGASHPFFTRICIFASLEYKRAYAYLREKKWI